MTTRPVLLSYVPFALPTDFNIHDEKKFKLETNTSGSAFAVYDRTERYRYMLCRRWNEHDGSYFVICMLNPSTATAERSDPTVRRCIVFAKTFGFGGLLVLNMFAHRSTDPDGLLEEDDPVGDHNEAAIRAGIGLAMHNGKFIAAWGSHSAAKLRNNMVVNMARKKGCVVHCLGTTKDGYPRHPLYVLEDKELEIYRGR